MRNFQWKWIAVAAACLVMGLAASAQDTYSTAQLEQFVAPVALYPDALLAQILMAATYPSEVVEASGWAQQNSSLQGDSLAAALDGQSWDASVKSLVPFPNVLNRMAGNEAWTQDLGNAFLAQPDDVMAAVQSLRHRAYTAGNLGTSTYQRVEVDQAYIEVVPVSVETIYVPAYNPMVVYGPGWGYPTYYYPAMMEPPPYYVAGNVISFGVGFAVGAALFGAFDWNHHNVYYGPNFYQYRGYHRDVVDWQKRYPGERPGGHNNWQHDPAHRGAVGYHSPVLEKKYGHGNPVGTAQKPAPEAHKPAPEIKKPAPETHKTAPETKKPVPEAHKPAPEIHKTEPGTQKPALEPKKPAPETQKPAPEAHKPAPEVHKTEPATQKPALEPKKPAPEAHKPAPEAHKPAPAAQKPAPEARKPAPAAQKPAPEAHNPTPVKPQEAPKGEEKKNEEKK